MPAAQRSPEEQETLLATAVQQARDFHAAVGRWPLPSDIGGDYPLPVRHFGEYVDGGWQRLWDEVDAGMMPRGRGAEKYRNGNGNGHAPDVEVAALVETIEEAAIIAGPAEEQQDPSPPRKPRKRSKPRPARAKPAAAVQETEKTLTALVGAFEEAEAQRAAAEAAFNLMSERRQEAAAALIAHPLFQDLLEEV